MLMDYPALPRSGSPLATGYQEEEEMRTAARKSSSTDYSSGSDSTNEDESESESEEEPYNRRGKKKTTKLNLSRGGAGSSDSDVYSPASTKSFDEVYSTTRKRASIDFHSSPILLRNKVTTSPGSPTQPRKSIFNKHGIKPIDLGGLRETLEEHDIITLRGQKRELEAMKEKEKALAQSISIAQEGYNDEGMDGLEVSLHRIKSEISSLEALIAAASPLASPHVLSATASPRPNSPTSRKFSQELKMELRQLDSRVAVYTSPRRQSKGNTWQLDSTETESERERRMHDRFDKVNVMLARHGPTIMFSEIKILDKVGEGNTSVVFEGTWNDHKVVVKQLRSPSATHEKLLDEVTRLQRLHHPNMVLTMGGCTSPPALVVEHMVHGNLYDVLHSHTVKLDTLLLLKMAKELASVLCHLHNQKTVHGNLWSKCIFVSQVDRHKSIRLGGLHLNKDLYTLDGRDRNPMAPRWRAPELTRANKITEKADVYGYGMVLWEMVTNKVPFRKFDDVTAAAKAAYEHLRPKISGTCPRILRRLITRCWAPIPDERPSFIEILKFFNHVEGKLFFIPEKGGIWTLDKEQEKEQEQMRETRFKAVVEFLKKKDIMLQFYELTLKEKVGEGSFAKVWEGMWGDYRVAVKKLRNVNISTNFFIREVANLQKSHHPNVVLFMGACAQPPCIVTEYMAGGTLYNVLHESRVKLDKWIFLKFARDIALGMAHLHSINILHRDLTSKNILLDEYQNVKISDFGLSREVEVEMTLAGICNPRWRPPEITKGITTYDGKVDVYCFGLVMYEMISGKIPFEKLDSVTAAAKAAYEDLRPTLPEDTPEEIRNLICKCWAKAPEDRPTFVAIIEEIHKITQQLIAEQHTMAKNYIVSDSDSSDEESKKKSDKTIRNKNITITNNNINTNKNNNNNNMSNNNNNMSNNNNNINNNNINNNNSNNNNINNNNTNNNNNSTNTSTSTSTKNNIGNNNESTTNNNGTNDNN